MKLLIADSPGFKKAVAALGSRIGTTSPRVEAAVRKILDKVRREGDRAISMYTRKLDGADLQPSDFKVRPEAFAEAHSRVDPIVLDSLRYAADRIRRFHENQRKEDWTAGDGASSLGQMVRPIDRVGLYVPGGKAVYPSSVLMNAIPAKVAGVRHLVMCVPAPGGEVAPVLLAAAELAGVDEIYRVGGAQAIAAMAYGTETIPQVDKIVGPGNVYVAAAKRLVFGVVDIDMVAGPSEILVIADESAVPAYVAADLLSQAEHDESSYVFLVTPSKTLISRVKQELTRQMKKLTRREIAQEAVEKNGTFILVRDLSEAMDVANAIAPEHLELAVAEPLDWVDRLRNAGAIFLGHYTPEAVGDYVAGPSHVLPTGGTARFFSPLSVDDFLKRTSVIAYTKDELFAVHRIIESIALSEGLDAHARAVQIRFSEDS